MKKIVLLFSQLLLLFFSVLMLEITLQYTTMEDRVGFLKIKQWVIENSFWKCAFYVHVFTSMFALIAGFTQFNNQILLRAKRVHRSMGKLYIVVVLFLSGPTGIIMGYYANGGVPSAVAFITLSVLWMYFTARGWSSIKKSDMAAHRNFMLLSYALTLSALTLRAWKWGIVQFFRPHPMDLYQIVAWLGWVPNLLLAFWYVKSRKKRKEASANS